MAATDGKLYRIFQVAGEKQHGSKADLAREISARRFDEFSSIGDDGERKYMAWKSIVDYVSFAWMINIIDGDLNPYVAAPELTRDGFDHALGDKVETFAEAHGFAPQKVRNAVRDLIARTPATLPTPKAVFRIAQPSCEYHYFYKAVMVAAYQRRVDLLIKRREVFITSDLTTE
jgi:hypothetical protein